MNILHTQPKQCNTAMGREYGVVVWERLWDIGAELGSEREVELELGEGDEWRDLGRR